MPRGPGDPHCLPSCFSSLQRITAAFHIQSHHTCLWLRSPALATVCPDIRAASLYREVCLPWKLCFLCIIFPVCVLPLVKQINHLLTPGHLVIHPDLWAFFITLVLSGKSSCSPPGGAFSQRPHIFVWSYVALQSTSYTPSPWMLTNPLDG